MNEIKNKAHEDVIQGYIYTIDRIDILKKRIEERASIIFKIQEDLNTELERKEQYIEAMEKLGVMRKENE